MVLAAASCAVYDASLVAGLADAGGGAAGGASGQTGSGGSSPEAGKGATQAGVGASGAEASAGMGPGGSSNVGGAADAGGAQGEAGSPAYYGSETLLAYYRFDSDAGTQVLDSSGHDHHGTLASNPNSPLAAWTTGMVDGALSFAGESFVVVPYSAAWNKINKASTYTVAALTYRTQSKAGYSMLVSRQYKTTTAEHFALSWYDGRPAALALTQSGEGPGVAPLDTWVHLAATYDGSTLKVYQDAVQVSNASAAGPMWQDDTSTGLTIGGNVNNTEPPGETFVGKLDELVLYSRVLKLAEIADLAAGKPPPAE